MTDVVFTLLLLALGVGFLARLSALAEESRNNSAREEYLRELLREAAQKKRIDELYGRDYDEDR